MADLQVLAAFPGAMATLAWPCELPEDMATQA